jgi:aspartate kinase
VPKIQIGGLLQTPDLALIQVLGLPPAGRPVAAVMAALGAAGISAQAVVECADCVGSNSLAFTVSQSLLTVALPVVERAGRAVQAQEIRATPQVALVAVYGPHFSDRPAIAGTMFSALAEAGMELLMVTTSISTVACVIAEGELPRALTILQDTFLLP